MLDIFQKYHDYYDDNCSIPRPQPTDFILEYFKDKHDFGFFIDVGAHDGIVWNNSLAVNDLLFWKGICIEANPKVYEELSRNRPNSICLNLGSSDIDGEMLFWKIDGYAEMLSGFYDDYDEKHIQRIHTDIETHGGNIEKIIINVEKLETTLDRYQHTYQKINNIDYLSIDVEGAELKVLQGINLNKYRPILISIEDNGYTTEPHKYLIGNKYKFLQKVAGDCFYESCIL